MSTEDKSNEHKGAVAHATADVDRIEAPVTLKAYFLCAFASFGGIFFGYDSGYINGVTGSKIFIELIEGEGAKSLTAANNSLITAILSAGTFFGAIMAGDLADWYGRRLTIIAGCVVYTIGCVIQIVENGGLGPIVAGRLIAGFGVGFVSAIIILYMSEIAPKKVRGALVSGYQFCITIGIMLAAIVNFAVQDRTDSGQYRIPIGIQFAWGIILATGLFLLPDSPRWYVKKGRVEEARVVLAKLRGQPADSDYINWEVAEIVANAEYEAKNIPQGGWFSTWASCFTGGLGQAKSNLRRTILGTSLQMMQQWTGVNFVFYYSTPFLQSTGAVQDVFLTSFIFTLVNVLSTPISFWIIERFGRRPILIYGALGMLICQFIVGAVGVTIGFDVETPSLAAVNAQISFIAIYIFFFATTWGPGAWVVIGEIFPLPIRSRGVALSTASNWLWNTIIAVITPYMTAQDKGYLRSKVFFIWGALCTCAFVYAYLLVPETKGLSLEQVDRMMEESTPRTSAKWRPHTTFAADMGMTKDAAHHVEHSEEKV